MTAATLHPPTTPRLVDAVATSFFAIFIATALILYAPTYGAMASQWVHGSNFHHGALVLPFSLWLIWRSRSDWQHLAPAPSLLGVAALLGANVVWLIGVAASAAIIEQVAFVGILICGTYALFGPALCRHWALPLGFLVFMVPAGSSLIPHLQIITSIGVKALLSVFQFSYISDGFLITTRSGMFDIAEACAGLRFLLAALMVSVLFAYYAFDDWRRRSAFLGLAIIIALGANIIRAFGLIVIATISDMRFGVGFDHIIIGWAFYGATFAGLFALGGQMARASTAPAPDKANTAPALSDRSQMIFGSAALCALIIAPLYAGLVVNRPVFPPAPTGLAMLHAEGWTQAPPDMWRGSLKNPDRSAFARYSSAQANVHVAAGYYTHSRDGAEIVTYANSPFDGALWRRTGFVRERARIFGRVHSVHVDLIARQRHTPLAAVTLYWLGDRFYTRGWHVKRAQLFARLRGQNPSGGVLMIAAPYEQRPARAVEDIVTFFNSVDNFDDWARRNNQRTHIIGGA